MRLSSAARVALPLVLLARCGCDDEAGLTQVTAEIAIMPATIDFGEVPIGATKRVKAAVFNEGTADLTITEVTVDPPFGFDSPAVSIRPGASGVLDVRFTPNVLGAASAQLRIKSDARGTPEAVLDLRGTGAAGSLTVTPRMIDFSDTLVGTVRGTELNIFNNGNAEGGGDIASDGFVRPEHFALASLARFDQPSPFLVQPRGVLTLSLTYQPLAAGADPGRVVFEICGSRCGIEVEVDASASQAGVRLEPASIDFGEVGLGSEVAVQLRVIDEGQQPVTVTALTVNGPGFTVAPSRTLPAPISPDAPLGVTLGFRPQAVGEVSGEVVVTTDDPALPALRAPLRGKGTGPRFEVVPDHVSFGVVRNPSTYRRAALLINAGSGDAIVRGLRTIGAPELSLGVHPGLPIRLAGGESAEVEILFRPTQIAEHEGTLIVTVDDLGDVNIPLSGGMSDRICEIAFEPEKLEYGVLAIGSTKRLAATLRNIGTDTCELVSGSFRLPLDPAFSQAVPFTAVTLGPGQTARYEFDYHPSDRREAKGLYSFITSDPVYPARNLVLHGRSDNRGLCLQVEPDRVDLGVVAVGSRRMGTVVVRNIGNMNCSVQRSILAPGAHPLLSAAQIGPVVIQPRGFAQIGLEFHPSTTTIAQGLLNIATDDPQAPNFAVPIEALSLEPQICVSPQLIDYGLVTGSLNKTFEISACGTLPVTVTGLVFTTPDSEFALVSPPAWPKVMSPGSIETITVMYTPADPANDTAVVTVQSNDRIDPAIDVTLTGGQHVVPPAAGRYLYYWQISGQGDIVRFPLQGVGAVQPFWGPRTGKPCSGCHSLSPDGRYVSLVELSFAASTVLRVIEASSGNEVFVPNLPGLAMFAAWNPDVTDGLGYEFVYSDGADLHLASVHVGEIGPLVGAAEPLVNETHPTWGPNGKIAFVRVAGGGGIIGAGPADLLEVPEGGGVATLIPGASMNGRAQYYPRFSPNGRFLAFTESVSAAGFISAPDAQIRLIQMDGSNTIHDLPNANGMGFPSSYPTWSVDGQYLSFASNRPGGVGGWDVYFIPIDPITGAEGVVSPIRGVNSTGFDHAAQWSP